MKKTQKDWNNTFYKKHKNYYKKYYQKNKKRLIAYARKHNALYQLSQEGKFYQYKRNAVRRKIVFELSFEQFIKFWRKPCAYCGAKIKTIGIDRVDSKKTYHIKNCKSCCFLCNRMKRKITERKFINQCKKIANFKRAF